MHYSRMNKCPERWVEKREWTIVSLSLLSFSLCFSLQYSIVNTEKEGKDYFVISTKDPINSKKQTIISRGEIIQSFVSFQNSFAGLK